MLGRCNFDAALGRCRRPCDSSDCGATDEGVVIVILGLGRHDKPLVVLVVITNEAVNLPRLLRVGPIVKRERPLHFQFSKHLESRRTAQRFLRYCAASVRPLQWCTSSLGCMELAVAPGDFPHEVALST